MFQRDVHLSRRRANITGCSNIDRSRQPKMHPASPRPGDETPNPTPAPVLHLRRHLLCVGIRRQSLSTCGTCSWQHRGNSDSQRQKKRAHKKVSLEPPMQFRHRGNSGFQSTYDSTSALCAGIVATLASRARTTRRLHPAPASW